MVITPHQIGMDILELPSSLRVVSLNCWGLKFISKFRHERLTEIGRQLAAAQPTPEIVGLQECWTQQDYLKIRELTKDILPYGKFYWSGVFGGGLAILSKWSIEESSMYRYPLNGRPAAFWRGDWYVGKGVACARIRIGRGVKEVVEVFCTHLHAPYEREPNDSYICHRTAQAWEIAKLMRHASERGHMVLGLGDFNMLPMSLAHQLIEAHAPVRDVWRILYPDSALGSAENEAEKERGRPVPTVRESLEEHGATCDSKLNTWRWSKQMQKNLFRGIDSKVDEESADQKAKRLDYVFFADNAAATGHQWEVKSVEVGMKMRHPELKCSLSDHFSTETTLIRSPAARDQKSEERPPVRHLALATYQLIQAMITKYDKRERDQRRLQIAHFWASLVVSIGCLTAVWWSPRNYVSFILMFVSTLGLSSGVLDGLMGFLFVKTELRALKEFKFDIDNAANQAQAIKGIKGPSDSQVTGKLREAVRSREDEPDYEVRRMATTSILPVDVLASRDERLFVDQHKSVLPSIMLSYAGALAAITKLAERLPHGWRRRATFVQKLTLMDDDSLRHRHQSITSSATLQALAQ